MPVDLRNLRPHRSSCNHTFANCKAQFFFNNAKSGPQGTKNRQ